MVLISHESCLTQCRNPPASVCLIAVVSNETMAKRPASAVGRRRPVCEYAQKAAMLTGSFRFKVGFLANCGYSLAEPVASVCMHLYVCNMPKWIDL